MSERSVRSCYHVIRMSLERAIKDGLIKKNPILGCKLSPPEQKEMKVLSREEIQRFLLQAKAEGMYELFLLELTTGLRRGELLALRWDDLNIRTGELHINKQVYPVGGKLITSEPKTKAANRTIILPPAMVEVLLEYRKGVFSDLMFPSRIKPDQPIDPGYVRKRLQVILERSGCKRIRFHDLRHTFATISLEHGMDIKTLSAIIGHVSAETTLNIYSHITDTMQQQAAARIDREIAGADTPIPEPNATDKASDSEADNQPTEPKFESYKGKIRKLGTGCVTMINDHLYEGRYTPTNAYGKRESHNIYAKTREECEEKLAEMIERVKKDIAKAKEKAEG